MRCLTSARYVMLVDIYDPTTKYDPNSGESREVWNLTKAGVPCSFHGILEGGIRVAGTTERFGSIYETADWAQMKIGAGVALSKRSQVRNVRTLAGVVVWKEEEIAGKPDTIFDVQGVTPIVDGFGRHTENQVLLQRHEIQ